MALDVRAELGTWHGLGGPKVSQRTQPGLVKIWDILMVFAGAGGGRKQVLCLAAMWYIPVHALQSWLPGTPAPPSLEPLSLSLKPECQHPTEAQRLWHTQLEENTIWPFPSYLPWTFTISQAYAVPSFCPQLTPAHQYLLPLANKTSCSKDHVGLQASGGEITEEPSRPELSAPGEGSYCT